MSTTTQPLRLNIGCGDTRRDGYVGVDIRPAAGADHVAAAWDLSAFAANSVDEVYSRHMLEHLDPNDARRAVAAWFAALRPGGLLRLVVPDLSFHAQQLLGRATNWSPDAGENEKHALAGFFGWRDESRGGNREDAHRWGYTADSLRTLLSGAGFEQFERVQHGEDSEPWHLHVTARKRDASVASTRETRWSAVATASAPVESARRDIALSPGQSASAKQAQAAAERVLSDWRGRGPIAVYGAGAHTRKVLPTLLAHAGRIAGITDDSPATWGTQVGRWTVGPPARVIGADVGGVLISSDTQQHTLAERAAAQFGERCAVLTLYAASEPGGDVRNADSPALAATGERQTGRCLEEIEIGHRARYYWAAQHLAPGARVLDAACGNGYGSRILAESGARVLGVDVAADAVAFAKHHFGDERIVFAVAAVDDGRSLRLAADRRGPFDAVVSLETLEHLERPETFLRDVAGVLQPEGELFCSTPNAAVMDLVEAPYHRRHFTTDEVRALLDACGFELIAWYGQEGMQILPARCTERQRYCLYHARRV